MNRFPVFLLLTLICSGEVSLAQLPASQPITYTPAQIERVAKLSELYGHIKFFHPYLGYKRINWDSAFAATAPLVATAKTDDEAVSAIRQLLAVLHDDATTVRLTAPPATTPPTPTATDSIRVYFTPDSTLVLKTNNYAGATDVEATIEKIGYFVSQLPKARTVLLDLRAGRVLTEEEQSYFRYALADAGLERVLCAGPIVTAGERMRSHSGFAPESGNTSGGYWSAFYTTVGETSQPRRSATNRPLAILVSRQTPLPLTLLALRSRPHVRLVSTEPLSDAQFVSTVSVPVGEGITVRFRTGEIVNPDGSLGLTGVPLLPATVNPDNAAEYLLAQLRTPPTTAGPAVGGQAQLPVTPPAAVYPSDKYPLLGYRLLAGAKIWSVIHYFHAYKDLMPTDWNAALRTAIGELATAADSTEYALAVARFYRHIQDGHGFINSSVIRHYVGAGGVPVELRFVDGKPVVSRVVADSVRAKGVRVGDVLTGINGEAVGVRLARLAAIQGASNEWTRLEYLTWRLLRGPVGKPVRVTLRGADGREKTVTLTARPTGQLEPPADTSATFRLLPGNIGYADLGRLQTRDVERMFGLFKTTKAIIFDMRGYPNGTAWAISPYLTDRRNVVGARFFRYAPNQPDVVGGDSDGAVQKYFFGQTIPANGGRPVYRGKTVMLVDERTQSQAEHTGLFFEAANGTEFIGSPTAGANGDVTSFGIPGGMTLSFSGHDVRHADGRQLQQVGLQPKILVRPTLGGIRAGRYEVLERAVQYLSLGK